MSGVAYSVRLYTSIVAIRPSRSAGLERVKELMPVAFMIVISRSESRRAYTNNTAIKTETGRIWVSKFGNCRAVRVRKSFAESPLLTMDSTALTATKSHITPVITKVVNSVEIKSCFVI